MPWFWRDVRELVTLLPIVLGIIAPVGVASGAQALACSLQLPACDLPCLAACLCLTDLFVIAPLCNSYAHFSLPLPLSHTHTHTHTLRAGALAQLTIAVCGSRTNRFYSAWYCSQSNLARNLVTAVVPSIIVTLYRSLAAVHLFYRQVFRSRL